jgi:hypothetical protein
MRQRLGPRVRGDERVIRALINFLTDAPARTSDGDVYAAARAAASPSKRNEDRRSVTALD